ncbi:MAG: proline iminopeptidase-family hydrolase [Candidatus Aureabacteria bacterium]|jgi:proline-specific peptidase|nr:proline iminopeptidase-family hydrolase [Candidatus Auribacterota bacterium]NLW93236.1 proline iminopeptidase-family hydrolase [Chlamydiota bacterium]HOE26803.1 proline iminopeptidase-family hydrolase [bacterium]HQM51778.1 proline iminopeptidase-family hydrolase [bacterium]
MGDAVDGNRTIREGTIPVPGGKVWYRIVNPEAPGIPLLALHGGPGATHDYLEPLETLADRRPVVLYDQLGGGNSDRPEDRSLWTLERFVEELATVRRSLGLLRVCLLGQSWGAMLAVDYLLSRRPEGVACLILSGPCLSASRWAADQRRYLSLLPEQTQADIAECEDAEDFSSPRYLDAMMAFYRRHLCRMEPWPECLNRTFERMGRGVYEHMWGPSEFTIRGSLKRFEGAERLGELRLPALFTCGRFDEAAPATTAFYHRMLPGSELAVLEEASHNHHLEKTGEYLALVRGLLDRVDPPLIRGQRLRPRPPLP